MPLLRIGEAAPLKGKQWFSKKPYDYGIFGGVWTIKNGRHWHKLLNLSTNKWEWVKDTEPILESKDNWGITYRISYPEVNEQLDTISIQYQCEPPFFGKEKIWVVTDFKKNKTYVAGFKYEHNTNVEYSSLSFLGLLRIWF